MSSCVKPPTKTNTKGQNTTWQQTRSFKLAHLFRGGDCSAAPYSLRVVKFAMAHRAPDANGVQACIVQLTPKLRRICATSRPKNDFIDGSSRANREFDVMNTIISL